MKVEGEEDTTRFRVEGKVLFSHPIGCPCYFVLHPVNRLVDITVTGTGTVIITTTIIITVVIGTAVLLVIGVVGVE